MFEHAPYAILLIDMEGKIIEYNPLAEDLLNTKKEELNKKKIAEFQIHNSIDLSLFDGNLKEKYSNPRELQITKPNGEKIWVYVLQSLLSLGNNDFIQLTLSDITEKKRTQQKLIDSEEKYKSLIATSPNSVILFDSNGFVNECNELAEIYIGLSKSEIIGKNVIDLFNLKNTDAPDKMKIGNVFFPIEFDYINKKGVQTYLSSYFSIIQLGDEIFIQLISQDISTRREAETLIKQEIIKLKELDDIKNEFIYRASHELKTPLNSINTSSAILLRYFDEILSERVKNLLRVINRGGIRLKILVEDLVSIAKIETRQLALNLKKENITKIINEIIFDMMNLVEERNLKMNLILEREVYLEVDKLRIEQVLINIISNAIKNTPRGGEIIFNMSLTENFVEIQVRDTGVGLIESEKKRIFKKFGKIERHGKGMDVDIEGSGLGLYISKEIIKAHKGKILVESEGRNKGSTFIIKLPIKREN